MRFPASLARLLGADPDRPDLDALRPRPSFDDWRRTGAPGSGRGADLDGSYEPGRHGGPAAGSRSTWTEWLLRGSR